MEIFNCYSFVLCFVLFAVLHIISAVYLHVHNNLLAIECSGQNQYYGIINYVRSRALSSCTSQHYFCTKIYLCNRSQVKA